MGSAWTEAAGSWHGSHLVAGSAFRPSCRRLCRSLLSLFLTSDFSFVHDLSPLPFLIRLLGPSPARAPQLSPDSYCRGAGSRDGCPDSSHPGRWEHGLRCPFLQRSQIRLPPHFRTTLHIAGGVLRHEIHLSVIQAVGKIPIAFCRYLLPASAFSDRSRTAHAPLRWADRSASFRVAVADPRTVRFRIPVAVIIHFQPGSFPLAYAVHPLSIIILVSP